MDLEQCYASIISELERGGRALTRLSDQDVAFLVSKFEAYLNHSAGDLEKLLTITEHSAVSHKEFEAPLLQLLSRQLSDRSMIFTLNCARKHIIAERFKKGQRLNFEFLEVLKSLLHHRSIEVVEWTLRTIEECGSQGIYFLREFDKIKPPPWKWFNAHQRAVREIIAMLENRWSRFEKP